MDVVHPLFHANVNGNSALAGYWVLSAILTIPHFPAINVGTFELGRDRKIDSTTTFRVSVTDTRVFEAVY